MESSWKPQRLPKKQSPPKKLKPIDILPEANSPPVFQAPFPKKDKKTTVKLTKDVKPNELDHEKEFIKIFRTLTIRRREIMVWRDFITMVACAVSNFGDKAHFKEREARYISIMSQYDPEEQGYFAELFAHVIMALELKPDCDFLGKLYANLNLQDNSKQQFFTPPDTTKLISALILGDIVKVVEREGYATINDCCCGSGGLLIAAADDAKEKLQVVGHNFQNHVQFVAQDIDEITALMCYIQLSFLGVSGYVKVGDTLTEPIVSGDTLENCWFTPMYFSDVWSVRRLVHQLDSLFRKGNE